MKKAVQIPAAVGEEYTREIPECGTLLGLAMMRPVKAFQIEHVQSGFNMCMVHFDHDGAHHLYQDGDGAAGRHLFFHVLSWQDDRVAEQVAISFFDGKFILVSGA